LLFPFLQQKQRKQQKSEELSSIEELEGAIKRIQIQVDDGLEEEKEVPVDKASIITQEDGVQPSAVEEQPTVDSSRNKELTQTDSDALVDALNTLSKDEMILVEEKWNKFKEGLAKCQEDFDDIRKEAKVLDESTSEVPFRLFQMVNRMIIWMMDAVMEKVEHLKKKFIQDLIAIESLEEKETQQKSEELKCANKRIQKVSLDSLVNRISEVLEKMGIGKDGSIRLDDVLKIVVQLEKQIEKSLEKSNQETEETLKGKHSGKEEKKLQ
jgi:hypothetical protein